MRTRNGIFGLSLIATALMCHAAPAKNAVAPKEGEIAEPGGGATASTTTIGIKDLEELRTKAGNWQQVESRLNSFAATLDSLFPEDTKGGNFDPFSLGSSIASRFQNQRKRVADLAEIIQEHFEDRIKEGASAIEIAGVLLRECAEKHAGKAAAAGIVEGCSAKVVDEAGNGTQEVYVIGVCAEKDIACIYATPPKCIPLKNLKPLKRGFAIPDSEAAMRNTAFPSIVWDKRED